MNPLECKACFEEYHPTTRRPRALPCGHSYCEPCLGILKTNQMIRCPTCRREHNVKDVTELMIVYDLIELLDSKQTNVTVSLNKGECEEHGCPLNFFCATHQKWICRDCTVLEHPKEKCSIRTKKQFLKEKVAKEGDKLIAEKENQEKCQNYLRKNGDEIKNKIAFHAEIITKLQTLCESHINKKTSLDMELKSTENAIEEIGVKNSELINMICNISAIKDFNDLEKASKKSEEIICKAQHKREDVMKKYPKKLDISSDQIKLLGAELFQLSLEFTQPTSKHEGITCDECRTQDFQGVRYSCLACTDYDLCAGCDSKGIHRHHAKLQLPKSATTIQIDLSSGILDSSGRKDSSYGPANLLSQAGGHWNPCDLPRQYNNWYIVFDLKSNHTVISISINNYGDKTHDVLTFKLESSVDNKNWISVGNDFDAEISTGNKQYFGYFYGTGRYWKFTVLSTPTGWQPWLQYLSFHGYQS